METTNRGEINTLFHELLSLWHQRVRRAQMAHFKTAVACERQHLFLGIPAVVLSTVVGSSVFASLQKEASFEAKLLIGTLSVLAAVLAAVQTFLRHSERAEKHRSAGTSFGALKKELEYVAAFPPPAQEERAYSADFLERWNRLVENSPTPSEKVFVGIEGSASTPPEVKRQFAVLFTRAGGRAEAPEPQ